MNMNKQNIKGFQSSFLVILIDTTNLIACLNLSCKQMQTIAAYFWVNLKCSCLQTESLFAGQHWITSVSIICSTEFSLTASKISVT